MSEIDDILKRVANNEATEEEMKKAEDYLQAFEQKLSLQIDAWEKAEDKPFGKRQHRVWLHTAVAAAACLILLFSVALWMDHSSDTTATATLQKDSFDNPEEAAVEAEKALMKFSLVINKATSYNNKY